MPAEEPPSVAEIAAAAPLDAANRPPFWRDPNRWSFQAGVGFITKSTIDEVLKGDSRLAKGDAAGQIYLFQTSYRLTEMHPEFKGRAYEVDVELPFVLGVVDQHESDPFMQYSGGFTLRWKQFPWSRWLYTGLETGVGFTYSQHVLLTDRQRHPGDDRSHLEIYWPVQLAFALPHHREHQLVLLSHHHSGGGMFHTGGVNTYGFAYRFVFGERER